MATHTTHREPRQPELAGELRPGGEWLGPFGTAIPARRAHGPRPAGEPRPLLARHLRFHHRLLALWRHTAAPPDISHTEEWTSWLEQRQRLLDLLHACDCPRLFADSARLPRDQDPLCASIQALHTRGLAMMESLLSLENVVRRALRGQLLSLTRRLVVARRAQTARAGYGRPRPGRPPSG